MFQSPDQRPRRSSSRSRLTDSPHPKPNIQSMMKEIHELSGISYKERMERTFQLLRNSDPDLIKNLASITPATAHELLSASGQLDALQKSSEETPAAPPAVDREIELFDSALLVPENVGSISQREKLKNTYMLLKNTNPKLVQNLASMTSASAQELLRASETLAAFQKK